MAGGGQAVAHHVAALIAPVDGRGHGDHEREVFIADHGLGHDPAGLTEAHEADAARIDGRLAAKGRHGG